jgi:hypothetical protein
LTPRPDSVEIISGGQISNSISLVNFNKNTKIKSAFIEDCKVDFTLPFKLTFSEIPSSPELEVNTDSLVIVKGNFSQFKIVLKDDPNEVIGTSIDGVFKQKFEPKKYVCFGINDQGCRSALLEIDITSSNKDNISIEEVTIIPNPVSNELSIQVKEFKQAEIYNIQGELLIETNKSKINISSFVAGKYLVKVYFGNDRYVVKRIIKI